VGATRRAKPSVCHHPFSLKPPAAPCENRETGLSMTVIGLTGGICSGKSTVADFLARLGAVVISADAIGHEAFKPHSAMWQRVVDEFGRGILTDGDQIDRQKLGEIVFGDGEALSRLNGIMHPGMHQVAVGRIEELKRQGAEVVVLEAPLLIEANWLDLVDEVWVAVAGEETVLRRCRQRSGLSQDQALARVSAQSSVEAKLKHADVVIDTDVTLTELEARVKALWKEKFA
jgi:dephospho-CoA kinase